MPRVLVPKQGLSWEQKSLGFFSASVQVPRLRVLLIIQKRRSPEPRAPPTTISYLPTLKK